VSTLRTPTRAREALVDALAPVLDELVDRVVELVLARLEGAAAGSPYLNVREAAEYLRCKPQRIYDLLSSRRLMKYGDGGRPLLLRSELDEYVARSLPPEARDRLDRGVAA
jgi:excisionase family DNA binding protein